MFLLYMGKKGSVAQIVFPAGANKATKRARVWILFHWWLGLIIYNYFQLWFPKIITYILNSRWGVALKIIRPLLPLWIIKLVVTPSSLQVFRLLLFSKQLSSSTGPFPHWVSWWLDPVLPWIVPFPFWHRFWSSTPWFGDQVPPWE